MRGTMRVALLGGGGCEGCLLEARLALSERYRSDGRPIRWVEASLHADLVLLCGHFSAVLVEALDALLDLGARPRRFLQIGDCGGTPVVADGALVDGCPPRPEEIREAVAAAIAYRWEDRPVRREGRR